MAVYDARGNALTSVYDKDGNLLTQCYDKDGNPLMSERDYDLVVMTYNVGGFSDINSQLEMQQAIIDTYSPDLIGLQECGPSAGGTIPSVIFSDYGTKYWSGQYNYQAFVSKSLVLSNITKANFEHQIGETRYWMRCYFQYQGKTICWITTHLNHKRTADNVTNRIAQMGEVFDLAEEEEYVIITADFNAGGMSMDDSEWIGMYKPFVDAGYNLSNCDATWGFTKTYSSLTTAESLSDLTLPTDNIITSGNIDIVNRVIDTTKLSYLNGDVIDHVPIVSYLKIR